MEARRCPFFEDSEHPTGMWPPSLQCGEMNREFLSSATEDDFRPAGTKCFQLDFRFVTAKWKDSITVVFELDAADI